MASKYDMHIDLGTDCAQTRAIRLVGESKSVLELGCATGYVSRILEQRGCRVVGIERNPEAAAQARQGGIEVIEADLDGIDYAHALGGRRFDVALCGDVLEHLREPGRALRGLRPLLGSQGYVVASIPNVVHASVLAEMLGGRFPYRPGGLLDDTHLRFFTRDSIYECFEGAGFVIDHLERLVLEPSETEFRTDLVGLPEPVTRALLGGEESRTYQFILTARPAEADPRSPGAARADEGTSTSVCASRGRPGRGTRAGREAKREAVRARIEYLEGARALLEKELAERQGAAACQEEHVKRLQDQAVAFASEVQRLHRELVARVGEVEWLHREVAARDEALVRETSVRDEALGHRHTELAAKAAEVEWLHREVALRDEALLRRRHEVDEHESGLRRMRQEVEAFAAAAESARARLNAAEEKVRELSTLRVVRLWRRLRHRGRGGPPVGRRA